MTRLQNRVYSFGKLIHIVVLPIHLWELLAPPPRDTTELEDRMINFEKSTKRNVGRADVKDIVIIQDGAGGRFISRAAGRVDATPYFLVRITFDSSSQYVVDKVPTGINHPKFGYVESPDEMIITDGDTIWEAARRLGPGQFIDPSKKEDKDYWILDDDEMPERLQHLSISDRDHIVTKIAKYCEELKQKQGADEGANL